MATSAGTINSHKGCKAITYKSKGPRCKLTSRAGSQHKKGLGQHKQKDPKGLDRLSLKVEIMYKRKK